MGTRSLIRFWEIWKEEDIRPVVCIYQQYDGYLSGVGKELGEWLKGKTIINGIGTNQHTSEYANGCGCLAAQFIRDFKTEVGNLYVVPFDMDNEDYNYSVFVDMRDLKVGVMVSNFDEKAIFAGTVDEFLEYINKEDDD